ncbi:hypothetical protein ASL20_26180 [Cupriavidus necator]|nr:hypothetical protein ASL20_26180 [Cupriavidus necator]
MLKCDIKIDNCRVMTCLQPSWRHRDKPSGLMLNACHFQPNKVISSDAMKKIEKIRNFRAGKIMDIIYEEIDGPLRLQSKSRAFLLKLRDQNSHVLQR